MIHSKAIDVLKTLSKEELKQFNDFIRSPFFNKNKNLIKLFDELERYYPEFDVENEKIHSKVYPGKNYNHNNLKKGLSELLEIEEKFLIQIRFDINKLANENLLIEELRERKLYNMFLLYFERLKSKVDKVNYFDYSFDNRAKLEEEFREYYVDLQQYNRGLEIKSSLYYICIVIDNLYWDLYESFVLRYGFNNCGLIPISDIFFKNFNFKSFLIELKKLKINIFFLELKYNLFMMLLSPEDESFYFRAKEILFSDYENFCDKQHRITNYLEVLRCYSIYMCERGTSKFYKELFQILKFNVSIIKKFYIEIFRFSATLFINYVLCGVKYDVEWTKDFISTFIKTVPEPDREIIHNASRAFLEFAQKNFEKCLEYSSKYVPPKSEILINPVLKIMSFKCYYELGFYDSAISLIDTFKHYLKRTNLISQHLKKKYIEIFALNNELLNLKINFEKKNIKSINKLKNKITASRYLVSKEWYLEKIEELEKLIHTKTKSKKRKLLKMA